MAEDDLQLLTPCLRLSSARLWVCTSAPGLCSAGTTPRPFMLAQLTQSQPSATTQPVLPVIRNVQNQARYQSHGTDWGCLWVESLRGWRGLLMGTRFFGGHRNVRIDCGDASPTNAQGTSVMRCLSGELYRVLVLSLRIFLSDVGTCTM